MSKFKGKKNNLPQQPQSQPQPPQGVWQTLFATPTPAKASGFAFTLSSIFSVGLSFVFLLIVFFTGAAQTEGYDKQDWYLYCAYLLPQLATAITLIFYFSFLKKPFAQSARGQKCPWKYFLIAFLLQVGLLSLAEVNTAFLQFLERFGYQDAGIYLPNMDGGALVGVLFVVAVLPSVFEELLFRGMVLNGLKQFGETSAVLLCGALFALYHQNPAQTIYQFCCGAAFALVAIRAGSVLPTIVSHLVNNAVIVVLTKLGINSFDGGMYAAIVIISIVCLFGSLAYLLFFDKKEPQEKPDQELIKAETKNFWLYAGVGVLLCGLSWLATLLTGF